MAKSKEENSKKEEGSGFGAVLFILMGTLIWWLFSSLKAKDNQIQSLQRQNGQMRKELSEVADILEKAEGLTSEAKLRLQRLIQNKHQIREEVRSELSKAFILVQGGLVSTAVLSMGKIIESSLKKIYYNDKGYKSKFKQFRFADMLTYAKETNLLDKDEYFTASAIRELRNNEAHELGPKKKEVDYEISSVIMATSIIIKLEEKQPKGWGAMLYLPPLSSSSDQSEGITNLGLGKVKAEELS